MGFERLRKAVVHSICAFCAIVIFAACSSQVSGTKPVSSHSKYEDQLPATDFASESSSPVLEGANPHTPLEKIEVLPPLDDGVDEHLTETSEPTSELRVKPALLLDHSFTIQLGYFESSAEASQFVSLHKLDADESGIAQVSVDGAEKHLLAYGIFSDKALAETLAKQMAEKLGRSLEVVSLGEIEAMSGSAKSASEITTY